MTTKELNELTPAEAEKELNRLLVNIATDTDDTKQEQVTPPAKKQPEPTFLEKGWLAKYEHDRNHQLETTCIRLSSHINEALIQLLDGADKPWELNEIAWHLRMAAQAAAELHLKNIK